MANPTWLSLHCLNGMNLLVPFSDTQKYPYDANYIMFVAILRLQGAAPFFLRSCFMGANTSAHHGELLVAWIVEAEIARMRVESEKSRVLYTFFHPLQHPVRQHWACQTYASTYSNMRCGWWGLYICLYIYTGLLEERLITEAEEPYWCNMDQRPLPPGMNVGSLVSSK